MIAGHATADGVIPFAEPLKREDTEFFAGRLLLPEDPCLGLEQEFNTWLDRTQKYFYQSACITGAWFDRFFGNNRYDDAMGDTFGRVGVSSFWDQRDSWDHRLRFRARFALPAMRNRVALLVGRADDSELIEERTDTGQFDTIPSTADRSDDDSFFVGLGFGRGLGQSRGFGVSVGARMGAPPEPVVKLTYRTAWELSEKALLRVRPIGYWRADEGFGTTLHVDVDRILRPQLLLRWSNFGNVSQDDDVEGVEWGTTLSLFQGLSNRRAFVYRLLMRGQTDAEVGLQNYGAEIRYRHRVLRKWLFLEYLTSVTWPKEFEFESRESNWGFGIGLEMYFGPRLDNRMF